MIKSVFNNLSGHQLRGFFNRWKKTTDKLEVAEEADTTGSSRMQVFHLNREISNLKVLLLEDGYTPKEITDILDQEDNKYRATIEKTLCRLYLWNLRDKGVGMHLLPFCFDKIKFFVRERKIMRYWITRLNNIIDQ